MQDSKYRSQNGIASLVVVLVLVLVGMAVGAYFYFVNNNEEYPGMKFVQQVYMPDEDPVEKEDSLSESDETDDIEVELDATDLQIDQFQDDLDDLNSDLESL